MGIARVQPSTNPCQMEQPRPHDTMYDAWVMTLDRIRPVRVMRGRVMINDHCHRQERFMYDLGNNIVHVHVLVA